MRFRLDKQTILDSKVSYYRQSLAETSLTFDFELDSVATQGGFGGRYHYLSFERVAARHTTRFCHRV